MRLKVLSLLAAVVLVAACESTPQNDGSAGAGGGATAGAAGPVRTGPAPGSQEDLVVNVGDRVFFGFDKFDLTPEARQPWTVRLRG